MSDVGGQDGREWDLDRPRVSTPGDPGDLLEDAYLVGPHDLPHVFAQHAEALGGSEATIYVADLQQATLVPFVGLHGTSLTRHFGPLPVDSTLAGRCYQKQGPVAHAESDDMVKLWLPLLRGSERIGVASFTCPRELVDDGETVRRLLALTAVVAHLISAKALYADVLINLRRRGEMGLAAEMQWALLPPLTYVSEVLAVSGVLEPAYNVAGDSIDYAIENGGVQFAIFDGMGHGLKSAQTAALAIAAYRNSRRAGQGLVASAQAIDGALDAMFSGEAFTTVVLSRLDVDTGLLQWLNAGHPEPLLFRDGHMVKSLQAEPCIPLGLWATLDRLDAVPVQGTEQLQPGDQILLYTDGVTEARSPEGEMFGVDRLVDLIARNFAGGLSTPESMRRVAASLLEHQQDQLVDDATLLLVQWAGPSGQRA